MCQAGRHLLRTAAWQSAHTHTHAGKHAHKHAHTHPKKKKKKSAHMHTCRYFMVFTHPCMHTPTHHMQPRRWTRSRMNSQTAPEVRGRKGEREKRRKEAVSGKLKGETGSELQLEHMHDAS